MPLHGLYSSHLHFVFFISRFVFTRQIIALSCAAYTPCRLFSLLWSYSFKIRTHFAPCNMEHFYLFRSAKCPSPADLPNAIREGNDVINGSVVTYTCQKGFQFDDGSMSVRGICIDGGWAMPINMPACLGRYIMIMHIIIYHWNYMGKKYQINYI